MKVKFIDFDRTKFNRDDMSGSNNIMGAELEVTIDGKTEKVVAEQKIIQGETEDIPVKMSANDKYTFYLVKLSVAGESTVDIAIVDESIQKEVIPETLILSASIKPFINLVWGGTVVMVLGFFFSLVSRYRRIKSESKKSAHLNTNGNGRTNGRSQNVEKQKAETNEDL
jgi:cytochrome c-type biogenesis protein CcmF